MYQEYLVGAILSSVHRGEWLIQGHNGSKSVAELGLGYLAS